MLDYERKHFKDISKIAGLDEAGRGCCAGPLVVACVIMPENYTNNQINDSKKLNPNKRKQLAKEILENAIDFSIVFIAAPEVDKLNPKQASKEGMFRCINNLKIKPNLVITDFEKIPNLSIKQVNLVKGDELSFNVACASILAKVSRDEYMINLGNKYPNFEFEKHKGYCTQLHNSKIKEFGIIQGEHRMTYKNVNQCLKIFINKHIKN
ncbi:ribonuclease HII [Mycoplasma tauri]|uniref:Ribonuclease n=1 Tax=Mycoplasma tauri TaxID=547987 RepID=A0A953NC63_9MOLU|nr:ribonuclease HII [Mycoplasma tauri]MBZ4195162.1 ribonuclease HII [Mycoplasma tauri]MBZ4203375.1 ribonuclease HII [Mycoplasma tauri]MBZ4212707.1 ribonuclease HII [Mycoplasma tauri]QSB07444.1 ribonuclease HII [Mycoplasma tauri]